MLYRAFASSGRGVQIRPIDKILDEIAIVLERLDHVARFIVNADHGIV